MVLPEWLVIGVVTLLLSQTIAGIKWGISMASKQNELAYRMDTVERTNVNRDKKMDEIHTATTKLVLNHEHMMEMVKDIKETLHGNK